MLIVDSHEKWTQSDKDSHIRDYLEDLQIPYKVRKLDIGDYMFEGYPGTSVDRKQNLDEVAQNLMNRNDKSRFWREVRRAAATGTKLIVLVEHGGQIHGINDVPKWKSRYSGISGRSLINEMIRVEYAYGVRWVFCSKKQTGRRIIELLEGKE